MKLSLKFGLDSSEYATWRQPITYFPPYVTYKGKKWEFGMYVEDKTRAVDYICYFSEVQTYSLNFYLDDWFNVDQIIEKSENGCVCGSIHTSAPNLHMFYCPKWTKI